MIQALTYPPETILEQESIRRWCMKPILVALLVGLFAPLYGQQQFCFSKSCAQTPATMFTLDRSDRQLSTIFRPVPTLSAYEPVAPLALSPSTRQFFQYSAPTDAGNRLGLASPESASAESEISPWRHDGDALLTWPGKSRPCRV